MRVLILLFLCLSACPALAQRGFLDEDYKPGVKTIRSKRIDYSAVIRRSKSLRSAYVIWHTNEYDAEGWLVKSRVRGRMSTLLYQADRTISHRDSGHVRIRTREINYANGADTSDHTEEYWQQGDTYWKREMCTSTTADTMAWALRYTQTAPGRVLITYIQGDRHPHTFLSHRIYGADSSYRDSSSRNYSQSAPAIGDKPCLNIQERFYDRHGNQVDFHLTGKDPVGRPCEPEPVMSGYPFSEFRYEYDARGNVTKRYVYVKGKWRPDLIRTYTYW